MLHTEYVLKINQSNCSRLISKFFLGCGVEGFNLLLSGRMCSVRTSEMAMRTRCVRWKQNTNVPEVRDERVTPPRRCLFPDRLEYVNTVDTKRYPLKYTGDLLQRDSVGVYLSTTTFDVVYILFNNRTKTHNY